MEKLTIKEYSRILAAHFEGPMTPITTVQYIFDSCEIEENEDGSAIIKEIKGDSEPFFITDWSWPFTLLLIIKSRAIISG